MPDSTCIKLTICCIAAVQLLSALQLICIFRPELFKTAPCVCISFVLPSYREMLHHLLSILLANLQGLVQADHSIHRFFLPHFAVPFAQNRKFCCRLLSKNPYLRRAWRWFYKNRNMLSWYNNKYNIIPVRTAVAQWLRCCAIIRKVAGSIPTGVTGNFLWYKILLIALWHWGRLSLQQRWVPREFRGGKGGSIYKADKLTTNLCRCHEIWEP